MDNPPLSPPHLCRHPTIGTVGLTEPEARKQYGDAVKVCESPRAYFAKSLSAHSGLETNLDNTKFRSMYFAFIEEDHREPTAYKLIVVGEEEKIVGVHMVGQGSDETMQGFGVAVKMGGMSMSIAPVLPRLID